MLYDGSLDQDDHKERKENYPFVTILFPQSCLGSTLYAGLPLRLTWKLQLAQNVVA